MEIWEKAEDMPSVNRVRNQPEKPVGVEKAFSDFAQFGGISDRPLKVDDVIQKVRVQVDEDGTRAAAVTEIIMADGCALDDGPKPVSMVVNRPFLVVIAEEETGAVCFAGAVVNPAA